MTTKAEKCGELFSEVVFIVMIVKFSLVLVMHVFSYGSFLSNFALVMTHHYRY